LVDFSDISYDRDADLLYKLSGQLVDHLRSYLPGEEDVENVLLYHQRALARLIHTQMQAHYRERALAYETRVSRGFTTLRANSYSAPAGAAPRDLREPVGDRQEIRGMLFTGFRRCLYPVQKFDSDAERRFALLLESEADTLKWFKPAPGQFRIYYNREQSYEPDFCVETTSAKLLCEPKRRSELDDPDVRAKARAAVTWCVQATEHEMAHGGKPWSYLLIPHDAITAHRTLRWLAEQFTLGPDDLDK